MAREPFVSIETEISAADQAMAQGHFPAAAVHLRRLIAQTRAVDYEYDDWCRRLASVYLQLGRRREAGFLALYLHNFEQARNAFIDSPSERARVLSLQKKHADAASEYTAAGLPVHGAVAWEDAKDTMRAAEAWGGLLSSGKLQDRPYERALCHTNLGLAYLKHPESERGAVRSEALRHLAQAQRLIEQVADDFETAGERERAFDCYQVLLKLGIDSASFENLSEGYLNCIRILKEDGLKTYVLQYYEDFLGMAMEKQEFHAAATLYREVADYTVRAGLPYHRHYLRRSAETWQKEAEKLKTAGAPMELVENSFLASIDALSLIGDFGGVRDAYRKLAALDVGDRKKARYAAIAERFAGAPQDPGDAPRFPEYMRQPRAYGDIWFVDLIEWELDGDPEHVGASIVGDLRYPDGIRRRALNLVLDVSEARARRVDGTPTSLTAVAETLGELQSYAALRPLERLFEHPDPTVRRAAVAATARLYFKRSFGIVGKGLVDRDAGVREAATNALRGLHFTHAFHPLARIFREHPEEKVRIAALESIGRIASLEAGELLVSVLRQETGTLRDVARRALTVFDNADVLPILEQHAEIEADADVRKMLQELLHRRRGR